MAQSVLDNAFETSHAEHVNAHIHCTRIQHQQTSGTPVGPSLAARQRGQSEVIKAIAWGAQHRLHARYRALLARGKTKQKVIFAVGRELLGFIWAIGVEIERTHTTQEFKRAA
jgi:hypothetical protein